MVIKLVDIFLLLYINWIILSISIKNTKISCIIELAIPILQILIQSLNLLKQSPIKLSVCFPLAIHIGPVACLHIHRQHSIPKALNGKENLQDSINITSIAQILQPNKAILNRNILSCLLDSRKYHLLHVENSWLIVDLWHNLVQKKTGLWVQGVLGNCEQFLER